jgi:hypothetical protein
VSRFPNEYDDGYDGRDAFEAAGADRPATMDEAEQEWVHNVGAMRQDLPWLLSDRDVWHRNPHYRGPAVPHPEDVNNNEELFRYIVEHQAGLDESEFFACAAESRSHAVEQTIDANPGHLILAVFKEE